MSKLLSQGGFGCVFFPGITCSGKSQTKKTIVTKLQKNDITAENEINIGKIIKTIKNYNFFFLPIISHCPIEIRDMDKKIISKCNIVKANSNEYILMDIPYIKNKPFFDILIDTSGGLKKTLLKFTNSYKYLLDALLLLIEHNIVHYDLKGENILYNMEIREPQIIDFGISIPMDNVTDENLKTYFYVFAPEYYLWPIEIHIINYLLHFSDSVLTNEDATSISELYTSNNKALTVFSPDFIEKYKQACLKTCLKYVDKPKNDVIKELLKYYKTWDNYALSILYLRIYEYFFPEGFHENSILINFSQLLLINISPDPNKRLTIKETIKRFSDLFYIDGNVDNYMDILLQMNYDVNTTKSKIKEDMENLKRSLKK
tara:strand:- start:2903 stop:4021 length:1119 start_codon:yes stop_codon:yes gene_type:complete